MKRIAILIICLALASCAKVETSSLENVRNSPNKAASDSPMPEMEVRLKPVVPDIKLSPKQQKLLDKSLPPEVREILEKAETFEVLAELGKERTEAALRAFNPNVSAKIDSEMLKNMLLEALYVDVATDEGAASCYEPRHGLHAVYERKTVDAEICFACAKFYIKSSVGNFGGTIRRENRQSENLFNETVVNFGNLIK